MAKLADAHGLGPCLARDGGSSPLIRTKKNMNKYELNKTEEKDISFKLPIPVDRCPIGSKFLDTRYIRDIRDQIIGSLRYKSSITGREYSDFQAMREEERLHLEDQRRMGSARLHKGVWNQQ